MDRCQEQVGSPNRSATLVIGGNCDVGVDVFDIMLAGANAECLLLLFSNVLTKIEGAIGVTIDDEVAVQQIEGSMREVVICELIVSSVISVP